MNDITIKKLSETPQLKEKVLKIIHQELKYGENNSFSRDFYPLFNSQNHNHCYLALKGQEVIGHIGVKKRIFGTKKIETTVALLGGIVIKKEFQGQGILKYFLNKIIEELQNEVAFYILWSDLTALYNKFSFWECGETAQLGDNEFLADPQFKLVLPQNLNVIQINKIKDLYTKYFENKFLCLKRSALDWEEIFKTTSCNLYIQEKNDDIKGYFFKDKGHDLQGIIHEMANIKYQELKGFNAWLPYQDSLEKFKPKIIYTAFVKIGNKHLLNKFLTQISHSELTILEINKDDIHINFRDIKYILQHSEFLRGIFGPDKISEFKNLTPPFFIAGSDSV